MIEDRLTDRTDVTERDVQLILESRPRAIVQFSRPNYDEAGLQAVNALCRKFGPRLHVRFFSHYPDPGAFDAAVLTHIPDVRSLTVDCLTYIKNEDQLSKLTSLKQLSFGVYRFKRPDFFSTIRMPDLEDLAISDTEKRDFDLSPLRACQQLRTLRIVGHTKGIDALAALPRLETLWLNSIPKRQSLEFVSDIPNLRSLTLMLGGRASIGEISHSGLEELEIIQVRGLEDIGPLKRFPALRKLHIENQVQIQSLSVEGVPLRELCVSNCKTLAHIGGLDAANDLADLRIYRTNLDLEPLAARSWPPTLKILSLNSSSEKHNRALRALLSQRGFKD